MAQPLTVYYSIKLSLQDMATTGYDYQRGIKII